MDNIYTFWYKLLPTYLNTLNYETHSEPQKKKKKKKSNNFKTKIQKK